MHTAVEMLLLAEMPQRAWAGVALGLPFRMGGRFRRRWPAGPTWPRLLQVRPSRTAAGVRPPGAMPLALPLGDGGGLLGAWEALHAASGLDALVASAPLALALTLAALLFGVLPLLERARGSGASKAQRTRYASGANGAPHTPDRFSTAAPSPAHAPPMSAGRLAAAYAAGEASGREAVGLEEMRSRLRKAMAAAAAAASEGASPLPASPAVAPASAPRSAAAQARRPERREAALAVVAKDLFAVTAAAQPAARQYERHAQERLINTGSSIPLEVPKVESTV